MFELIILGGGPTGYTAAERAAHKGLKVALFEQAKLGGVCLNEGCIPSKTILNSAKIFDYADGYGEKYGVFCEGARMDLPAVIARKNKVVRVLGSGIESKLKAAGVTLIRAHAVIEGRVDGGFSVCAEDMRYEAKQLLLAAGSQPVIPNIPGLGQGLESGFVCTSREMLSLTEAPARLAVIGGGVIGLEMASMFRSMGSEVTVLEMLDHIGGQTEREIAGILQKNYAKKGVEFILNARVSAIGADNVTYEKDGESRSIQADRVLLSIGRRADTEGLGLESIGVVCEKGAVVTDVQMKTNVAGVFAAGDINGRSMLAHTAMREAEVAVNVISGDDDRMDYDAIPSVIYTNPEAAGVGETLESAVQKGIAAREVKLSMRFSGRYVAENEGGDGIFKLIVDEGGRLIGAHLLANPASEIIGLCAMAISMKCDIATLKKIVLPHPSVSEIIHEGIFMA